MRLVLPDQLFVSSMLRFGQKASRFSFCEPQQIKMLLELPLYRRCPNLGQTTRMLARQRGCFRSCVVQRFNQSILDWCFPFPFPFLWWCYRRSQSAKEELFLVLVGHILNLCLQFNKFIITFLTLKSASIQASVNKYVGKRKHMGSYLPLRSLRPKQYFDIMNT